MSTFGDGLAIGMVLGACLGVACCVAAFTLIWINRPRPEPPREKDSVLE